MDATELKDSSRGRLITDAAAIVAGRGAKRRVDGCDSFVRSAMIAPDWVACAETM